MSLPMQMDFFGGETPMSASGVQAETPVPRRPGWYAVATRTAGPRWFHLLSSAGVNSTVVTRCGLRGHVVDNDAREMVPCPECTEASLR